LFKSILNYFKKEKGNLIISNRKKGKTVILELNNIHLLFNTVIPLYSGSMLTNKLLDFINWSYIVKINYYGYHKLPEGKELIQLIKEQMNNYRLSTNCPVKFNKDIISEKLNYLFSLPSPYEIKKGIRFIRNTDKLVPHKINIIVDDSNGNKEYYNGIISCSLQTSISRKIIKNCLITGKSYKGFTFKFDTPYE
jgi:hypothetical protein